jgi:hypothetical protein
MSNYYLSYRDIEDRQPRKSFDMLASASPEATTIQDQVIPGWFGAQPIHIRWYHQQLGPDEIHLLTYTHKELRADEAEALVSLAHKFAQEQP